MSNILIIKHGSLGDLIQANGAIKDIKNFYKIEKFFYLQLNLIQFLCLSVLI
jgi:ADP-heptose:LPS heptosyltransferase